MNPLAEQIKDVLTMPDIYAKYCIETNNKGFICCPFHTEKTASLGVYSNGKKWKCFGCSAGGSVIDFVMQYFNLNFSQTIMKLSYDFGFSTDKPNKKSIGALSEQRRKENQELNRYRSAYDGNCHDHRNLHLLVNAIPIVKQDKPFADEVAQGIAFAKARLEQLRYWFDENHWR